MVHLSNSVVLSILSVCLAYGQNNQEKFPEVGIYNAKLYADPLESEPKNVIIEDEDAWLGLACTYHKAVRWVYEDEVENPVQVSYSLLDRRVGDFSNDSTYTFETKLEILFKFTLGNHTYLACVAYEDDSRMTVVSGINLLGVGTNFTVHDDMEIESKKNILSYLIPTVSDDNEKEDSNCSLKFLYLDETSEYSVINYLWTSEEEFVVNLATSANPFALENVNRKVKQIEGKCTTPNYPFPNEDNHYFPGRRGGFLAVYFSAQTDTEKRVAKGFHTISNGTEESRFFYFVWEDFPEDQMYDVTGIPDDVYDGDEINIIARWSPFYFSYGLLIIVHRSNAPSFYYAEPIAIPPPTQEDRGTIVTNASLTIQKENSPIQNITVNFPRYNSSKWVTVQKTIKVKESQDAAFDNDTIDILTFNEGDVNIEIVCRATGIPLPFIEFKKPRSDIEIQSNYTTLGNLSILTITFLNVTTTTKGNYSCVASNFLNRINKSIEINVIPKGPDRTFSRNIFISIGVASLIFLIATISLFLRIRAKRQEYERNTAEAISEFLCGTSKNISHSTEPNANHEYNSDYELPINHWHLTNEILGQGSFAVVVKGYISLSDGEKLVAVKKIMSPSNVEDFKCALYELKIMTCIGSHQNIVNLIAACTDKISDRQMLLAMEYCCYGDLLSYLQKRRSLFISYTKDGQVTITDVEDEKKQAVKYDNVSDSSTFSTLDLYKWSFQTANAMSYLESKKVVHGDLSARNLLLGEDRFIKVGDFGLARQMLKNEENKPFDIAHESMPWKWMAIECLKNKKLSAYSDIWSYGVTLWEIFSLGEIPYPGFTWGPEFLEELEKGMRMGKPKFVTDEVYDLMVKTWSTEPHDRPTFDDVKLFFMKAVGKMGTAVDGKEEKHEKAIEDHQTGNDASYCILIDH